MKLLRITSFITISTILIMLIDSNKATAQLTGMQSVYFENQYLVNPAMAGLTPGLNFNIGYQSQWTNTPGGPKLGDFTLDYNSGNNVGLGFTVTNDNAGLISRTRAMGTYAYHLPVSEDGRFSFGLSFGINDSYIDYSKVNGDQGDASVSLFNQRRIYMDGDLGVAYTSHGLTVQAVVPNLGSTVFKSEGANLDVDRSTFYTAISYKFPFDRATNNFTLEPLVAFRGIKGYKNMADIGGNVMLNEYGMSVSALYHTNQSFSTGIGFDLRPVRILFSYTSNLSTLSYYADNTFEFGLKYSLGNKGR